MMRYHWIYHLHRHHTTTLLSPDFNPRVSLSTGSPGDPPMRIPRRQLLCCKWTMGSYLLCLLRLFVCEIKMTISLMWLIFKISDCVSHRYGNDLIIGANLGYHHWRDAINRSRNRKSKITISVEETECQNALVYLANLFFILSSCKDPINSGSRDRWCTNHRWLFVIRISRGFLSAYYLSACMCQGVCYHKLR